MKPYNKKQAVINELYTRFKPHDVPKDVISDVINLGLKSGLSLEASAVGARMTIPEHFGFHEYFSIQDVMEITGESEEEVKKRADQLREQLLAEGKDPREFFPEISFAPGIAGGDQ